MLKPLKAQEILIKLQRKGFIIKRQKGSHIILKLDDRIVVVPFHGSKDVPVPTIKSILRQGLISEEDFNKL